MLAINDTPVAIVQPITDDSSTFVRGLAALNHQDVQAICRELKLPLPTPDVALSTILDDAGLTPGDVYVRLERATAIDAMIAAAALRRGVKILPQDPRLAPMPHRLRWDLTPDGKAGKPKPSKTSKAVADPGMPPEDHVVVGIGECRSAPGSKRAERFALYRLGATVADLRSGAAKLKSSDIRRHISEGIVTFGPKVAS